MRTLVLLLIIFVAIQAGDPVVNPTAPKPAPDADVIEIDPKLTTSKQLMRLIQGINEKTIWIIEFHDNDPEPGFLDHIKASLKNDASLKDQSYQSLKYRVGHVDINNKEFDDAMQALGMTSNQFQSTYPVALVMRQRKGLFAWGYDLAQSVVERLPEVADGKTDAYA